MKDLFITTLLLSLILVFSSCEEDETTNVTPELSETEKSELLYMLEEEKLARDVYTYFDELWGVKQFTNIKESEKNHIGYVSATLDMYEISYTILPEGQFDNMDIQNLYDQFIVQGEANSLDALIVGATIEDIDIADLEELIGTTTNSTLLELYERLQCGAKNHMRGFVKGINNAGGSYAPQFITEQVYDEIMAAENMHCHG